MIPTRPQHHSSAPLSWAPQNLHLTPQNNYYSGRSSCGLSIILCLKWLTNTIHVCKTDTESMDQWKWLRSAVWAVGTTLLAPANFTSRKYHLPHMLKEPVKNPYVRVYIHKNTHTMYVGMYVYIYRISIYLFYTEQSAKRLQQLPQLEMRLNEMVSLIWHQMIVWLVQELQNCEQITIFQQQNPKCSQWIGLNF